MKKCHYLEAIKDKTSLCTRLMKIKTFYSTTNMNASVNCLRITDPKTVTEDHDLWEGGIFLCMFKKIEGGILFVSNFGL